jgi:hypothetical protein
MGLLDNLSDLPNLFLTNQSSYLPMITGNDPEKLKALQNQSMLNGIIGTAVGYLAQPKNQRYGSAIPYLAKAYQGGQEAAQNTYDKATTDYVNQQKFNQMQNMNDAQTQLLNTEGIKGNPLREAFVKANPEKALEAWNTSQKETPTELDKLIAKRDALVKTNPNDPNIKIYNNAITKASSWEPKPVSPLTDDAVTLAAQTYLTTGVMPALGQGSAAMRGAIQNKAAELNKNAGISASQGAANLVENKANIGGINQLTKQATMIGGFERNAQKNLEVALQLSDQVDRTGVPVFNKWIQSGQKSLAGNPSVSAFNAANETFVNEYAKIMSGSMGNTPVSDAARQHAHDLLSTVQTKDQYNAVVNVLKQDMGNRISGMNEELAARKSGLSGQPAPQANQSQPKTSGKVKFLGFE